MTTQPTPDNAPAVNAERPTPIRFSIIWRGERGEYCVSLRNYDGGDVVNAEAYDALEAAHAAALTCIAKKDEALRTCYQQLQDQQAMPDDTHDAMYQTALSLTVEGVADKLKEAEGQLAYLHSYVIPEKDRYSRYWHDLAQERIAQLAQSRQEVERLRGEQQKT
jgi:hypothetical protein